MKLVAPDLSAHVHNPNVPLIGHGVVEGSTLFRGEPGVITYYHRDEKLDHLFPATDPITPAGTARILTTPNAMRFQDMARWVTGCTEDNIGVLSRAIVEQQLDITRTQWNALIKATEGGEDFLLINRCASFTFARTGKLLKDKDCEYPEVVVLCADRRTDDEWLADVRRLESASGWLAGLGLILRNGHSA